MADNQKKPDKMDTYGLEPILTVEEVATFLRMNKKSVYAAISDRTIPSRKVGRRVVIFRDALLNWLRSNRAYRHTRKVR